MKEKNDFTFQFKRKRRFRQRVAYSISSQHEKKKNIEQIAEINRNFLKNKNIILIINNYTLKKRTTHVNIS